MMLRYSAWPSLSVEKPGHEISCDQGVSFEATATNVPLVFPSNEERRELGRTRITEITALNARSQ